MEFCRASWLAVEGRPLDPSGAGAGSGATDSDIGKLEQEHIRLYESLVNGLASGSVADRQAVLRTLASQGGLHSILPQLVRKILQDAFRRLSSPEVPEELISISDCVKAVSSLLANPRTPMETYLHQILPFLLSCVVISDLSEDSLEVRAEAGRAIALICKTFSHDYPNLYERVGDTLIQALDSDSLRARFGAITALRLLGSEAVERVLLHKVSDQQSFFDASVHQEEKCHCEHAVHLALGTMYDSRMGSSAGLATGHDSFAQVVGAISSDLGEGVLPHLSSHETRLATSFI